MFDEQKEPEDIFSETEPVKAPGGPDVSPGSPQSLGGVPTGPDGKPLVVESVPSRGPSKLLFVGIAVVVMLLIAGGIWFFFLRDSGEPEAMTETEKQAMEEQPTQDDLDQVEPIEPDIPDDSNCGNGICDFNEEEVCPEDCELPEPIACGNGICEPEENADDCPIDCLTEPNEPVTEPEPANQPLDSDGDGLSDEDERSRGTNPQSADTDADGLTDREEVILYETDPTNPDTDGDSFLDGDEVKAGYNPNGEGRLLNVPQ